MNSPKTMCISHGARHLLHQLQGACNGHGPRLKQFTQRVAANELHDQRDLIVFIEHLEDMHERAMVESGTRAGFGE